MDYEQASARCWVEIDLDVIEGNYDRARAICGEKVQVIPVLKANAYGLGATRIGQALAAKGARLFAVADVNEALELKRAADADVLVLGMTAPCQMEAAIRGGIVITAYSLEMAGALNEIAKKVGLTARVHIKLDTGLHRLGLDVDRASREALAICRLPGLKVEGLFTHLALRTPEADAVQIERLLKVAQALRDRGIEYGLLHACDSIGMVRYPGYRFDAVRPGAWLYGVTPTRYDVPDMCRMPVRFMTRVVQLRDVAAGEYLGYDEDHPLERDCRVATLSAGYADGYPRVNSAGMVEIRGRRAPVAGLVCMDQMTVDVSGIPEVREGDAVTLLGDGITNMELWRWSGVHRNDLLSRIGRRVPRVYRRGARIVDIAGMGECVF